MKKILLPVTWLLTLALAYWLGSDRTSTTENPVPVGATGTSPAEDWRGARASSTQAMLEEARLAGADGSAMDPVLVLRGLARNPESAGLWERLREATAEVRPYEAEAALASVLSLPAGPRRDAAIRDLLSRWAEQDPQAAMAYMENNVTSMRLRGDATRGILAAWGRTDPAGAVAWVSESASDVSGRVYRDRLLAVVEGYAERDPVGAFQFAASLPDSSSADSRIRSSALNEVISGMVRRDQIGDALSLVSSLPEGETQARVFASLIGDWAQYDPERAAQHLDQVGGAQAERAKRELMRSWADFDPSAAADWLGSLSADDPAVPTLVTELIGRWTRYDLDASAAWLNQMPPSPEIDRAVAIYTFRSAQEDPAGAMSWAESITSENTRQRLMARVAREWQSQDPNGLNQYLQNSDLTDEQKQALLEAPTWGGGRRPGDGGGRTGR